MCIRDSLHFGQRALELRLGRLLAQRFQALGQGLAFGGVRLELRVTGIEGGITCGKNAVDGRLEVGPECVFDRALQGQRTRLLLPAGLQICLLYTSRCV